MRAYAKFLPTLSILILFIGTECFAQKAKFGRPPKVGKKRIFSINLAPSLAKSTDTDWKMGRLKYVFGIGATNFLGDLGGQNGVGKPLFYDLDYAVTRYNLSFAVRYHLLKHHALRAGLYYGRVKASDALTSYPNRKYRNISIKSPIVELSAVYEWHFIQPKTLHLAGARTTHIFDGNRFGAYAMGGIGGFYFNPKGEYNKQWHALQPMGTEGQGLPGGAGPYSRINVAFPVGGGITYLLNNNITIGLEYGYRWTTTDYIDDASTYYYDNNKIREARGPLAAHFADPSQHSPEPHWYKTGQPRGNPESKDTYMFLQFNIITTFQKGISNKEFKPKKRDKGKAPKKFKVKKHKKQPKKFKNPRLRIKGKKNQSPVRTF